MRGKIVPFALLFADILMMAVVPYLALLLRFEGRVQSHYFATLLQYIPLIVLVKIITFYFFGLYNRLWRYAGIRELVAVTGAVTVSSLLLTVYLISVTTPSEFPRSIHVLSWLLSILFVGASRLVIRFAYTIRRRQQKKLERTLIIGAGDAGAMIAREIINRYTDAKEIVGFLDDDPAKYHKILFGAKVLTGTADIVRVVYTYHVDKIIIAMPSVERSKIGEIVRECKNLNCSVQTVPGLYELLDGDVTVQQLRNVDIEDLLGREPVKLDIAPIKAYIANKRILVTGAGGSIGSELCRQIAKMSPQSMVLLGKGENSIYEIHSELRGKYHNIELHPIIADVRDEPRVNGIFATFKPQVVFHAAAHKHVPLMEAQPQEAVRNNIFGTKVIAEAADRARAEVFVMISTDKAVNPTSVMGATKRVAELIIQNMSQISNTRFCAVRFGNVLGSRGSVVPLFKKQIAMGGPITITHPDMKRYFMTIPEASQLVLQAGSLAKGGEVFVLDMGEPIKIIDMAKDLIQLSGFTPDKDIEITYTGLRPGEKLFEELLTAEEGTSSTKYAKILMANLKTVDTQCLLQSLQRLQSGQQLNEIINILANLIPTYRNYEEIYMGKNHDYSILSLDKRSKGDKNQLQAAPDLG